LLIPSLISVQTVAGISLLYAVAPLSLHRYQMDFGVCIAADAHLAFDVKRALERSVEGEGGTSEHQTLVHRGAG